MPIVHYALKANSFLMMGTSESIGNFSDLFVPVDKKSKIYVRQVARQQQEIVRREGLQVKTLDGVKTIAIEVIPLKIGADGKPYLLVLFQEFALAASTESIAMAPARQSEKGKQTALEQENSRLKQELATTREYLVSLLFFWVSLLRALPHPLLVLLPLNLVLGIFSSLPH
jgi:hypothetical protein